MENTNRYAGQAGCLPSFDSSRLFPGALCKASAIGIRRQDACRPWFILKNPGVATHATPGLSYVNVKMLSSLFLFHHLETLSALLYNIDAGRLVLQRVAHLQALQVVHRVAGLCL